MPHLLNFRAIPPLLPPNCGMFVKWSPFTHPSTLLLQGFSQLSDIFILSCFQTSDVVKPFLAGFTTQVVSAALNPQIYINLKAGLINFFQMWHE
jgi:hypothetical protein